MKNKKEHKYIVQFLYFLMKNGDKTGTKWTEIA